MAATARKRSAISENPSLVGFCRHTVVHIGPFEVLSLGSLAKIGHCIADTASIKEFVPHLGMLLLIVGCFLEDCGNLLITILAGLGGEIV